MHSTPLTRLVLACVTSAFCAVALGPTQATRAEEPSFENTRSSKERNFRISRVTTDFPEAPNFQLSGYARRALPSGYPSKWLRVEMEFDSEPDWADGVEVRWYLQAKAKREFTTFTTTFRHNRVKRNISGQRHMTAVFMRPRDAERHVKNQWAIEEVAVQIFYQGRLEDTWPRNLREGWWEQVTPVEGILLDVTQTPFGIAQGDRYEQISVK